MWLARTVYDGCATVAEAFPIIVNSYKATTVEVKSKENSLKYAIDIERFLNHPECGLPEWTDNLKVCNDQENSFVLNEYETIHVTGPNAYNVFTLMRKVIIKNNPEASIDERYTLSKFISLPQELQIEILELFCGKNKKFKFCSGVAFVYYYESCKANVCKFHTFDEMIISIVRRPEPKIMLCIGSVYDDFVKGHFYN